jgi:hypothetical protein
MLEKALVMDENQMLYWVALNGPTVTANLTFPFAPKFLRNGRFRLTPTPQWLFGFLTLREAKEARDDLMDINPDRAGDKKIAAQIETWKGREDVIVIKPENPEPFTRNGITLWHTV